MKTLNLTIAACLFMSGVFAQLTASNISNTEMADKKNVVLNERNENHYLNEADVKEEGMIKAPAALNEPDGKNYVLYMEQLYQEFRVNDYDISFIKEGMQGKTGKDLTRFSKALHYLEDLNAELKIDFKAFVNNGVPEDWHLFREEMNEYLTSLQEDIALVKSKL